MNNIESLFYCFNINLSLRNKLNLKQEISQIVIKNSFKTVNLERFILKTHNVGLFILNKKYNHKTYNDYCLKSKFYLFHNNIFKINKNETIKKQNKLMVLKNDNLKLIKFDKNVKLYVANTIYKNHMENIIYNFSCCICLQFFKTNNIFQSALYLLDMYIYYLLKKVPFF